MTIQYEIVGSRRPISFFPPALTDYWALTADNPHASLVYLLHFSHAIGTREKRRATAQHYLGFCTESRLLLQRVRQHTRGVGAKITAAAVQGGGQLHIAAVWAGRRDLERQLKNRKCTPSFCPICRYLRMVKRAEAVGQTHFLDLTIDDVEVPF